MGYPADVQRAPALRPDLKRKKRCVNVFFWLLLTVLLFLVIVLGILGFCILKERSEPEYSGGPTAGTFTEVLRKAKSPKPEKELSDKDAKKTSTMRFEHTKPTMKQNFGPTLALIGLSAVTGMPFHRRLQTVREDDIWNSLCSEKLLSTEHNPDVLLLMFGTVCMILVL